MHSKPRFSLSPQHVLCIRAGAKTAVDDAAGGTNDILCVIRSYYSLAASWRPAEWAVDGRWTIAELGIGTIPRISRYG